MKVSLFNRQKDLSITPFKKQIEKIAQQVVAKEKALFDEVSITFITDPVMRTMHKQYFNDPSPTDVISFPLDSPDAPGYKVLGELFICPQTAILYAKENGKKRYEELTLYIVHGLLHLLGYDDIDPKERKIMRQKERAHIKALKDKKLLLSANNE
ncbi:MAG TPA: rRNA maturation RNase YbeY [Chlamydiales bacterium]|nr:rRNA maturation RNase YbeY [Chlamydiales bacterium]